MGVGEAGQGRQAGGRSEALEKRGEALQRLLLPSRPAAPVLPSLPRSPPLPRHCRSLRRSPGVSPPPSGARSPELAAPFLPCAILWPFICAPALVPASPLAVSAPLDRSLARSCVSVSSLRLVGSRVEVPAAPVLRAPRTRRRGGVPL